MARKPGRLFLIFSGLLVIVGALLYMQGGRQHPMISEKMGKFGSDAFFWEFAKMMVYDHKWMHYHQQMLIAPTLWTLGAFSVVVLTRELGERRWTPLGFVALSMGSVLWIVTYIYDGLVSPEIGRALLASQGDKTLTAAITQTFASGQWFTIRVSLWGWMLIAAGTAALSIGMFTIARSYPWSVSRVQMLLLGVVGLVLGVWSLVAFLAGAYSPGPMVSDWWLPASIATQAWYLTLGIGIVLHAFDVQEKGRRKKVEAQPAVPQQRAEQVSTTV